MASELKTLYKQREQLLKKLQSGEVGEETRRLLDDINNEIALLELSSDETCDSEQLLLG